MALFVDILSVLKQIVAIALYKDTLIVTISYHFFSRI